MPAPLHVPTHTRAAGILLHITSLPSPWGIGDLGPEAEKFLDFLKEAGQCCWQFLPLGPTLEIHGHSPYMSTSTFAGNPLLLSPDYLLRDGWIEPRELDDNPEFYQYLVRFHEVAAFKEQLLKKAFAHFLTAKAQEKDFAAFCDNSPWLADYALFVALGEKFGGLPWHEWPPAVARREPAALATITQELADRIQYHKFVQFLFAGQWREFKKKAEARKIRLIGDIPIYVALNSADVWADQACFQLDPTTLEPEYVAGVPPDYFSPTGQAWGNPLYRWNREKELPQKLPQKPKGDLEKLTEKSKGELNETVMLWWRLRLKRLAELVDVVRIDHFRAFESYWRIPAGAETAEKGEWVKGPGAAFFQQLGQVMENLNIIAEDLGTITPPVAALRESLGFAGMKVLQFAFDGDPENLYLPWNYTSPNCVVYTGTHDNETTLGWYLNAAVDNLCKERARRAANSDGHAIHLDFIKLAYASIAALAIIPLQDALGFGNDCRMNSPGSNHDNWAWRCAPRFLTKELAEMLYREVTFYNRLSIEGK
ncbi:MAG: 4-alpha-glucanotransferase [Deltaproteobacteria bacterium]|nr:4-alpha-glucanotransferase [Deltaproteobacteria bacterium]